MTGSAHEPAALDPGPCPLCGGTAYRINWIDIGDVWGKLIPGSVSCVNPNCPPPVPELCSRWD